MSNVITTNSTDIPLKEKQVIFDTAAKTISIDINGERIPLGLGPGYIEDYTAFEVYASAETIPAGGTDTNLGGDGTVIEEVVGSRTHRMLIRTGVLSREDNDVVVDWGDGSLSVIADGDFISESVGEVDRKHDYVLEHTYSTDGKYIVRVYGKDYYNIGTPRDPDYLESKYNLICRILDHDLPLASCVTNLASLCAYAKRLLSVHVPAYMDMSRIYNISNMFVGCRNLQSVKGLKNKFLTIYSAGTVFSDCYALTTLEFTMPTSVSSGISNKMFQNLINFGGTIESLIPSGGFVGGTLDAGYLFSECRKLTGTVPADQFWNNRNVRWVNTETAFLDCPAAIREQVPTSWGGTEDYGLLTMNKTGILNVVPISIGGDKNGFAGGTVSTIGKLCGGNRYVICNNNDINDLYATDCLVVGDGNVEGAPTVPLEERIEKSDLEIEILFKVRSVYTGIIQIMIPDYISWIGPMPDLVEGKTYIINILNWEAVCTEYTPGAAV